MTLHLLQNNVTTLQTLHENTLRQWPVDTPFCIPVLSTPDEVRNYLRLLPDSTSIVVQ